MGLKRYDASISRYTSGHDKGRADSHSGGVCCRVCLYNAVRDRVGVSINPTAATPTHGQTAPANQQKFSVFSSQTVVSGSCPVSTVIASIDAVWTTSDPVNTQIDSTPGIGTNGLATCVGATTVPAILTATVGSGSSTKTATASLTCK